MNNLFRNLVILALFISLAANVFIGLKLRDRSSSRVLIQVNDQAIRRKDLEDREDYLYTKDILRQMILSDLVMQQAAKEGVTPTDNDVQDFIDQLNRSTPQIEDQAKKTDPTLVLFKEQIKSNLALRNLRIKGITVTDAEARAFYSAHKNLFLLPQQTNTLLVIARDKVGAIEAQRLLQNGVKGDIIAQQQGLAVVGVNAQLTQPLPPAVGQEVLSMKPGEVRVIPVGTNFIAVKANSIAQQGVPSYDKIKPQVEIDARLAKAPSQNKILQDIIRSAKITAEVPQYQAAIPDAGSADAGAIGQ